MKQAYKKGKKKGKRPKSKEAKVRLDQLSKISLDVKEVMIKVYLKYCQILYRYHVS